MQILRDDESCPRPDQGTVVTIGAYDGVHRGHAAVIDQVKAIAEARGMATAVITFDCHPASVVRPDSAPKLLTDLDQKLELLDRTGLDFALVIHFDKERSSEAAEDFVRDDLVACLNAKVVVVGEDFHFGHRRRGNVDLLRRLGADLDFEVEPIALVGLDGRPASADALKVSSTACRAALIEGDLGAANEMLGRPHEVRGVVAHGDERARELGFATANVAVPDETCLPRDGIYAGWYLRPDAKRLPAAISLGRRPTFYDDQPYSLLEAHVIDWTGDLYGEVARVQFTHRLRDELKFDSVEALISQMGNDVAHARQLQRATTC